MSKEEYIEYYKRILKLNPDNFSRFYKIIDTKLPYSFRIMKTSFDNIIRKKLEKYSFLKKNKIF